MKQKKIIEDSIYKKSVRYGDLIKIFKQFNIPRKNYKNTIITIDRYGEQLVIKGEGIKTKQDIECEKEQERIRQKAEADYKSGLAKLTEGERNALGVWTFPKY